MIRTIVTAAVVTVATLSTVPAAANVHQVSGWAASTSAHRCETTATGRQCATLKLPPAGSPMALEARRLGTWRHIPTDDQCRTVYLGYGRKSLQNGRDVWSVESRRHAGRFHHYRVTRR